MPMKSRVIPLFLSLFTFVSSIAQVTVRGDVRDSKGEPLPNVLMSICGSTLAVTDARGAYSFEVEGVGKKVVTASLLGFKDGKHTIQLSGKTVRADFVLKEDFKLLGEVVVLAPNQSQVKQNSTYSAMSLDVKPLVGTLSNLNQLVNHSSGVVIREEGGVGSNFDLTINGLSGNAIRYFVNGIPLFSMGSGVTLATIPVNLVDRVEVYKGVVPPELGLDALGGAVNIVTKRGGSNYLDLSLSAGSFHTYIADLNGGYKDDKTKLAINGSLSVKKAKNDYIMRGVEVWNSEANEYQIEDRRRFHDGYKSLLSNVEIGFAGKHWADEAFVGVSYSTSESQIQTGLRQSKVVGEALRRSEAINYSLRYSKRNFVIDHLDANFNLTRTNDHTILVDTAYRVYRWDGSYVSTNYNEVLRRAKAIRHTKRPIWNGRANLAYAFGGNSSLNLNYSFISTLNHRYDTFDQDYDEGRDQLSTHNIGLSYGQYFLDGRLHTNLFFKNYLFQAKVQNSADESDQALKVHTGYGLGVRYTFSGAFSIKTSFERATRLPSAREFMGNGVNIYPNLKLRPEIAYNLNVGMYGRARLTTDLSLGYETSFFYRDVKDYIHRVVQSDEESSYENIGASRVVGAEAELKVNYKKLDLTLNATYLDERDKARKTILGKYNPTCNNRIPNKPWTYTNAIMGYTWYKPFGVKESNIRLNAIYNYIHWYYLTWEAFGSAESKAVIPSQHNVSAGISWAFDNNRYTISLQGNNLLDLRLYDNFMLQKPGRSVMCKFRLFIN